MYYLYNDKNEYCGYSDIKISDNCTNIPIEKIVTSKDKVFFNKEKNQWEYDFYDFENEIKEIENLANYSYGSIFSNIYLFCLDCGTYAKPKEKEITILIPCWGKAEYIEETVKSCVNQTMKAYQIIVLLMDEESQKLKDKLENLCDNVKCIIHERLNVCAARTHLVDICPTEYFVLLDADDILSNNFLEGAYKSESSIVYPNYKVDRDFLRETNDYRQILGQNMTALLNKEAFYEIKLNNNLYIGAEDLDFNFRLFYQKKWKIEYCYDIYYYYKSKIPNSLVKQKEYKNSNVAFLLENKQIIIDCFKKFKYLHLNWYINNIFNKLNDINISKNDFAKLSNIKNASKLLFLEKLNKSRNKTTLNIFNKEKYLYPKNIDADKYLNKKFDVLFLSDGNIIIRKDLENKTKNMFYFEKILYLLDNYSCMLDNNSNIEYILEKIIPLNISFNFELHRLCNLKCSYCCQKNFNEKVLTDNEMYKNFDEMINFLEDFSFKNNLMVNAVNIVGGEVSIFHDDFLKKVLERVKNYGVINVYTNGIVKNNILERANITKNIHITDFEKVYKIQEINCLYNIVVTNKNKHLVKPFLEKNNRNLNLIINLDNTEIANYSFEKYLPKGFEFIYNFEQIKEETCNYKALVCKCAEKSISSCCSGDIKMYFKEFKKEDLYKHKCKECKVHQFLQI